MEVKKKGPQRAIEYQRENQVHAVGEGAVAKKVAKKKKSVA